VGTYNDNGGVYTGPQFTAGDGSSGFLRDYSGAVNVKWFGVSTSIADCKLGVEAAIVYISSIGGGTILFPPDTDPYLFPTIGSQGILHLVNLDNIHIIGYGATFYSSYQLTQGQALFDIDGCNNITLEGFTVKGDFVRALSTTVTEGILFCYVRSDARDSNQITFRNINAEKCFIFVRGSANSYGYRVRGIVIENCSHVDGYYGASFGDNGDLVNIRGFKTTRLLRSYFAYGVSNHDVQYTSIGGDYLSDCLIKAYENDTTDIKVKATILENTSNDSHCTIESQHDPVAQPIPAKLENISVDINDTLSSGAGPSMRFAYYQNGSETAVSANTLFDGITIKGRVRQFLDVSVEQPQNTGLLDIVGFRYLEAGSDNPLNKGFKYQLGQADEWTPILTDSTNEDAVYTSQHGSYVRIGNLIHFQGYIAISSLGSITGALRIKGFPFQSASGTVNFSTVNIGEASGLAIVAGQSLTGLIPAAASYFLPKVWSATTGTGTLSDVQFTNNGSIAFSGTYMVDQ